MKPIEFEMQTKIYAKNQPPYLPLPVYEDKEQGGRVFHCWQLTFKRIFNHWLYWLKFFTKVKHIYP